MSIGLYKIYIIYKNLISTIKLTCDWQYKNAITGCRKIFLYLYNM